MATFRTYLFLKANKFVIRQCQVHELTALFTRGKFAPAPLRGRKAQHNGMDRHA